MPSTGLMDTYEAAMRGAVADAVQAARDVLGLLGDRPWGSIQGTREQQLEQFLAIRDDKAAWGTIISDWEKVGGRKAAERAAVKEFHRLETMLTRAGGAEAVRAALAMKRVGAAAKVVQQAQKQLDRPPITILPPLTGPTSDLEILGIDPALVQQALGAMDEGGSKDGQTGSIAAPMSLDTSLGAAPAPPPPDMSYGLPPVVPGAV